MSNLFEVAHLNAGRMQSLRLQHVYTSAIDVNIVSASIDPRVHKAPVT